MEITRDCSIDTFYKALEVNNSKSFTKNLIIKLDPEYGKKNSLNKKTTLELIKVLKKLNPSLDTLWILRDETFKNSVNDLKADLQDIRQRIERIRLLDLEIAKLKN